MKKLLIICFALAICFSATACGAKEETKKEETKEMIGMPNPVVEYSSLEEINEKIGVNLLRPSVMGISNERFSIIGDTVAQYVCEINGLEWTFRGARITDEDISGIHSEHNEFIPGQDFGLDENDFYLERFFDGDRQYTIVVKNPISEDGKELLGSEEFADCYMELMLIQKQHMDDPLVGDYQNTDNQGITAYVERQGDEYMISVNRQDSDYDVKCWTMVNMKKDGDRLTYLGERIEQYTYDAEGNEISSNMTMTNNIGYFEIKDGKLYWTGAAQDECQAYVFEKIAS